MVTVEFRPLASQVYVYPPGCSYDQRSPHILTMDCVYIKQGVECYLSNIKGEFTREIWRELRKALAQTGVVKVDYEHRGKNVSVDLLDLKQTTERMKRYRQENTEMYSPET